MTFRTPTLIVAFVSALAMAPAASVAKDHHGPRFEVSITNLTRGQQFTPFLVVTHRPGVHLFNLGAPASAELSALAEEGNTAPLTAALSMLPDVSDIVSGAGLTNPGATTTLFVDGGRSFGHLSLAAMLIPTNDGFVALDSVPLPHGSATATYYAMAFDAGSERNDESCASIPGPSFSECNGSVVALALALYLATGTAPGGPATVVVLHDRDARPSMVVSWAAGRGAARTLKVRVIAHAQMPAGTSWQVWLIGPAGQEPVSLGLIGIEPEQTLTISAANAARLGDAAGIGVTVEGKGGSPSGRPSLPYLLQGVAVRVDS